MHLVRCEILLVGFIFDVKQSSLTVVFQHSEITCQSNNLFASSDVLVMIADTHFPLLSFPDTLDAYGEVHPVWQTYKVRDDSPRCPDMATRD